MNTLTRTLTAGAVAAALASTMCGSKPDSSGSGVNDGGSGSFGTGPTGGGSGNNGGGTPGGGFVSGADGAVPEACGPVGSTRSCCSGGTQTCNGIEFGVWGPCLDATGAPMACHGGGCDTPATCGSDSGSTPPPPDGSSTPPPPPAACSDRSLSNEPEILVGYEPANGQTVGLTGQIKVWVDDENSPFIAPMEQVDNTTGAITAPGDRTATATDGLLYEPALYLAPQSPTNGGTPHFPQWVKGSYNNNPPSRGTFTGGAAVDPLPPGAQMTLAYMGEFVWDVSALGIGPGSYTAVFSVHDGDHDRAIGCINIVIQ